MDEISASLTVNLAKGFLSERIFENDQFDIAASSPAAVGGVPSIGHSAHEALPMGDVATAGWALFKNLDEDNYVQVGVDNSGTFIPFLKLFPGEFQFVRLATSAPYAKASTAAVQLKYQIWDA